ncbi:MAG: Thiol peroxidase [Chlamydiales bacterium]|nr:Thiol peroxidase [Chlamydiales bacterium]
MSETITMKGKPLTLKGSFPKKGDRSPDCLLTDNELDDVALSSFKGKPLLIMTVPSLDTSVCSKEAHRFNQELGRFGSHLVSIAISMDLPYAQKRWCAAEDVDHLIALSDYKHRQFGEKFGVFIPDLGLLARAIYILDSDQNILFSYLVKELVDEPDYEAVLEALTMRVG